MKTIECLAYDQSFEMYFRFGGIEENRYLLLNLSTQEDFNNLFTDLAWVYDYNVVRHNNLPNFLNECIEAAALRLGLNVINL